MSSRTLPFIPEIVQRLVRAAQPEQVIIFGSFARGETVSDSDLDLLVIESEPFSATRSRFQEIARVERALGRLPVATDLLVYSREEAGKLRHCANHVVGQALREGNVVYSRP